MKTFIFKLFIRTNGQEFNICQYSVNAKDYDSAVKIFNAKDLPFHHFATVERQKTNIH